LAELLVKYRAEPRRTQYLAHELVVRDTGEEMVALRRDVVALMPFLALERDVGVLLLVAQALEQLREFVAVGVLSGERDEEELVAELAELREGDRVGIVEPLEGRRPVEGEA